MKPSLFLAQKINLFAREAQSSPTVLFRKDFKNHVSGNLRPGVRFIVYYDAERLPCERSMRGAKAGWWITMSARYRNGGEVTQINLWSRTGLIVTGEKKTDEPGEGTMMKADLQIPDDADFLELWFVNSGDSGKVFYDSNYGRNYIFAFTGEVEVLDARVDASDPQRGAFVATIATSSDVETVTVRYFFWTTEVNPPVQHRIALSREPSAAGDERVVWRAEPGLVPRGTAINFDVEFMMEGRVHVDDNGGRHYLVPAET